MLKHWEEMDLYHELLKKNEGKPRFALHDGPPFSNGALHMGHALNKSLKDFITRSYAMRGYYTPYIPGWDNHGMPIESAIIKEQKLNRKADERRRLPHRLPRLCRASISASRWRASSASASLGDWEHPYKTMDPGFEAEEVKVFGAMYKKGYIYKGLKPVYWCYHDETALAEAEIEYQDDPCTTVYVKFPMHDDLGKLEPSRQEQAQLRHLDDHDLDAARQPRHRAASRRELRRRPQRRQRRNVHRRRGTRREGHGRWQGRALHRRRDPPRQLL